jgi:hypothetical protein
MAENPENNEYWHCSNYHVCRNIWEDENNLCKSCSSQGKSSYVPTVRKVAVQSYSASEISTVAPSESISENTEKTYKRQKSSVWEHFKISEVDPKKAICVHCPSHKNTFSYSNGGTTNLKNHLSQHKAILNKDLKNKKPITDYFKHIFNNELFEDRLINWIVKDDQSFQVVENESFKEMMSLVKPGLNIPSRNTVKRRVMEQFQNKRDQMIEFFDHLDAKVSFTTDCWTSPNGITF